MKTYEIICEKCLTIITIKANNLKEAEEKSTYINCCKKNKK